MIEFEAPPLPYAKDALEPAMSRETLEYHYDKHHKGYVAQLKSLIGGHSSARNTLPGLIRSSAGAVFNAAAQVYNHTFFWNGMKPHGGGAPPSGDVASLIGTLGGWEKFRADFIAAGLRRFGSGYVWLVLHGPAARITESANAECPLTENQVPLLTCDVWEHAYYLDHRNNRKAFLEAFCDKLINWDFVAQNLAASKG